MCGGVDLFHIFFIILCSSIQFSNAARGHKIEANFKHCECIIHNAKMVQHCHCSLDPDEDGKLMMNVELNLFKDIHAIIGNHKLVVDRNNGRNETYLTVDLDMCSAMSQRFDNFFFQMVNEEMHRISNVPYECPLKQNTTYYMHNFTIWAKNLPTFLPDLKWAVYANFHAEKKLGMSFNTYGTLVRKVLKSGRTG